MPVSSPADDEGTPLVEPKATQPEAVQQRCWDDDDAGAGAGGPPRGPVGAAAARELQQACLALRNPAEPVCYATAHGQPAFWHLNHPSKPQITLRVLALLQRIYSQC